MKRHSLFLNLKLLTIQTPFFPLVMLPAVGCKEKTEEVKYMITVKLIWQWSIKRWRSRAWRIWVLLVSFISRCQGFRNSGSDALFLRLFLPRGANGDRLGFSSCSDLFYG